MPSALLRAILVEKLDRLDRYSDHDREESHLEWQVLLHGGGPRAVQGNLSSLGLFDPSQAIGVSRHVSTVGVGWPSRGLASADMFCQIAHLLMHSGRQDRVISYDCKQAWAPSSATSRSATRIHSSNLPCVCLSAHPPCPPPMCTSKVWPFTNAQPNPARSILLAHVRGLVVHAHARIWPLSAK